MSSTGLGEPLYEGQAPITLDVVFVHGLHGDRINTWSKGKICWPRDLLKDDLPNARILSWGYDASVMRFLDAAGQQSVAAHAMQLLADLSRRRRTAEEMQRPIIFVCHSLGGLIVKDALAQSYHESRQEPIVKPKIASIKPKTMGVVFAGTPHRGSDKARWVKVATNLATFVFKDNSSAQATALCRGSETLERLQTDFARVSGSLRIYTFCEEYKYSEAVGKIVDNDSATLGYNHENTEGLPGSHSEMVKFSSRNESGYERLTGSIIDIVDLGPMEVPRAANKKRKISGIAIRSYRGQDDLHITFIERTVVRNVRFVTRELWKGTCNGKTGLFPREFIEVFEEEDTPLASPTAPAINRRPTWKVASVVPKVPSPLANDGIRVNPSPDPISSISETLQNTSLSTSDPQYKDWLEAFWISCEEGRLEGVKKQIARGIDVNTVAKSSDCIARHGTALTAAVWNGHIDVVRCLLNHGARPNQPGNPKDVSLPLHIAASLANKPLVKLLLNKGAKVDVQGGAYRFALTAAAVGGDISIMRLLIDQGADLHARDLEGETAMHGAVIGGRADVVEWLVAQGLDHNIRGDQGTALELAIQKNKEQPGFAADIVVFLSDGNVKPLLAPTIKPQAAQKPNLTVVTEVVEETEAIDPKVYDFLHAILKASLMIAAKEGSLEDLNQLLSPPDPVDPNDPYLEDGEYGYPLHAAAANGHILAAALLLERGANVNAQGFQLGTALHFAVYQGHAFVAALLIAWGADVNAISDVEGGLMATPLEVAAANGQAVCVRYLLTQGADVNLSGGTLGSALHAAATSSNSLEVVQALLEKGANVQKLNNMGLSAADLARAHEYHQTKYLLKQWGCPRAPLFSAQRFVAWSASLNVRVERQQAVQREQEMQNLIGQYAAQLAASS